MSKISSTIKQELSKLYGKDYVNKPKGPSRKFRTLPKEYTYKKHPATTQLKYNAITGQTEYDRPRIKYATNPEVAAIERAVYEEQFETRLPEKTRKKLVEERIFRDIKEGRPIEDVEQEIQAYRAAVERRPTRQRLPNLERIAVEEAERLGFLPVPGLEPGQRAAIRRNLEHGNIIEPHSVRSLRHRIGERPLYSESGYEMSQDDPYITKTNPGRSRKPISRYEEEDDESEYEY